MPTQHPRRRSATPSSERYDQLLGSPQLVTDHSPAGSLRADAERDAEWESERLALGELDE